MQLQIDMPRPVNEELERWKAVKFPDPIAEYGFSEPNKILQREFYTYAKEDNFNALFHLLSNELEVLSIIFKHVAASGNSLLHVAASHGSEDVTHLLCHHFPLLITRENFLGDNALHLAARAGRFDKIQNLVEHVKIHHRTLELASLLRMKNNKGNTPLHDAVIKRCREVACFLLYEDLEVSYHKNKEDKSPLYLAVESCDGEMIDSFIEAMPEGNLEKLAVGKPDIILPEDKKGGNLLHVAASMGFLSGARLLVSRCPVAVSQRNDEGNLPIHVACQKGHLEVVRELLAYWLDPMDFLNEKGQNILHVAAGSGQMKIVDEILRNRDLEALINEKDYDGNTPLHLAAMYCRSEIVQALVSDVRVDKRIVNSEKLKPSGVVVKLLQGGRFKAPKSDGMNKLIDTKHEDDAARGVWNKSQEAAVRKMRKVLVEADDKTEFDINLIFNSPRTTLTREELDRGVGNLLVVAVLVVGVTFAGAITVPGSGRDLNSDSSKYLMKAYIIFDMVAMNLSLIAAIILCQISLGRTSDVRISMDMATYFNFYSLLCLGLAFTSVLAITVQERTGFCIRYQICFLLYQCFLSFRLLVSTSYSLLSFVLASPFKLMARMKRRITSSSNWIA